MEFSEGWLNHIYNRGNNKQQIFFNPDNYDYFLKKIIKFIAPHCDLMAYCMMPNHFHFMVHSSYKTVQTVKIGNNDRNILSEGIRNLLQTYTKAINKQNNTTGSLFQQNTKAKCLSNGSKLYDFVCLHYIHQNPMKAKLVKKMEHWPYSSFNDYCGTNNGALCNIKLTVQLLDINMKTFYEDSYKIINENDLKNIF